MQLYKGIWEVLLKSRPKQKGNTVKSVVTKYESVDQWIDDNKQRYREMVAQVVQEHNCSRARASGHVDAILARRFNIPSRREIIQRQLIESLAGG